MKITIWRLQIAKIQLHLNIKVHYNLDCRSLITTRLLRSKRCRLVDWELYYNQIINHCKDVVGMTNGDVSGVLITAIQELKCLLTPCHCVIDNCVYLTDCCFLRPTLHLPNYMCFIPKVITLSFTFVFLLRQIDFVLFHVLDQK